MPRRDFTARRGWPKALYLVNVDRVVLGLSVGKKRRSGMTYSELLEHTKVLFRIYGLACTLHGQCYCGLSAVLSTERFVRT